MPLSDLSTRRTSALRAVRLGTSRWHVPQARPTATAHWHAPRLAPRERPTGTSRWHVLSVRPSRPYRFRTLSGPFDFEDPSALQTVRFYGPVGWRAFGRASRYSSFPGPFALRILPLSDVSAQRAVRLNRPFGSPDRSTCHVPWARPTGTQPRPTGMARPAGTSRWNHHRSALGGPVLLQRTTQPSRASASPVEIAGHLNAQNKKKTFEK